MTDLQNLSLKQLKIFKTIVKEGNLARASEKIGLTAPAVSTALKALEDQIGTATIRRSKNGKINLLPVGEEVLRLANRVEFAIQRTELGVEALRKGHVGHVMMGVVSTAKYFAPKIVSAAFSEIPGLKIDLLIGNRSEIIAALEAGQCDLAVMGRAPRYPPVEYVSIGKHPHFMIASPARDWDGDIWELAKMDFLVREDNSGTRILFERFMSSSPIAEHIRRVRFSSNESIKQAVMADLGIAFISASTCELELEVGRLKILPVPGLPIVREWYLVWPKDEVLTPATQRLCEFVVENKNRLVPNLHYESGG